MNSGDIRAYYAAFGQREWQRLERAEGVVEFSVTTAMLAAHLPATGCVLDVGGGPGRYTEWLADRGYRVTLADLSPELLDIARARLSARHASGGSIAEITEADARDLSRWPDACFDAVLSLGPMYHMPRPIDRERATRELARVLRPGGVAFVALMPWLAFVRRTIFLADERRHLADPDFVAALRDRGEFFNDVPERFTDGYGVRPEEVEPFFEGYGFAIRTLVSTHGLANGIEDELIATRTTDPAAYDAAIRLLIDTAAEPGLFGLAGHLLYVGERTPK
ncbi:MAG TPA: class I SAM-dependent methyltransferase [Micromonosporaceae bacterium]|jgi:SAM-dependent methyltransferase